MLCFFCNRLRHNKLLNDGGGNHHRHMHFNVRNHIVTETIAFLKRKRAAGFSLLPASVTPL
jgi:hypothetical protein